MSLPLVGHAPELAVAWRLATPSSALPWRWRWPLDINRRYMPVRRERPRYGHRKASGETHTKPDNQNKRTGRSVDQRTEVKKSWVDDAQRRYPVS